MLKIGISAEDAEIVFKEAMKGNEEAVKALQTLLTEVDGLGFEELTGEINYLPTTFEEASRKLKEILAGIKGEIEGEEKVPSFDDWMLSYWGVDSGAYEWLKEIRDEIENNPPDWGKWKLPLEGRSSPGPATHETIAQLYSRPTDVNEPIGDTFQGASRVPLLRP